MITMADGLSARGRAFFREKARRQQLHSADESPYGGPEDLVARLRELDRVWGGVQLGHYDFGTAAAQSDEWPQQRAVDGQAVAAFGTYWSRTPIYVDASGRLFEREDWSSDAPVRPMAESVLRFIERLALADWLTSRPVAAELDRRLAGPLAQALGLEPLAAASGADAAWFGEEQDDGLLLCDGQPFRPQQPVTSVQGPLQRALEALRRAQAIDAAVGAHLFLANPRDPSPSAPDSELRRPDEAVAAPPLGERVLPLRSSGGLDQGVVDLRADGAIRVVESHDEMAVVETVWTETALHQVRFLSATAHILPLLSEQARAALSDARVLFDPRLRMDPEHARRALSRAGVQDPERIVELEQALGGLQLGDDEDGAVLGLDHGAEVLPDGRVSFGTWSDAQILADTAGRLHVLDDIDGTDSLLAETPSHLLERYLRAESLEPREGADFKLYAFTGERLAKALGAKLIAEMSDASQRYWQAEGILVLEEPGREGRELTYVRCTDMALVRQAAHAIGDCAADCSTRWSDVRAALEEAGLTPEREADERPFEASVSGDEDELSEQIGDGLELGELPRFYRHPSPVVRRAVIEREDLSLDGLEAVLAATPPQSVEELIVLDGIARHPAANPELLERLAAMEVAPPLWTVLPRAVAMHPAAPPALLERLVANSCPELREAIAVNPQAPAALLDRLSGDSDPRVRRTVAAHPALSPPALARLASDVDKWVRLNVASHPNTPEDALAVLAGDSDSAIAFNLAARPLPQHLAVRVAHYPAEYRDHYTAQAALPVEVLADLARSTIRHCREGVAANPSTPQALLVSLLADDEPDVRNLALGHPNLSESAVPEELRAAQSKQRQEHPLVKGPFQSPPFLPATASLGRLVDQDTDWSGSWVGHCSYPAGLLPEHVDDPDLADSVAGHPWAPTEVLERVAQSSGWYARANAGRNVRTPITTLEALAADAESSVRAGVLENRHLPTEHLERLARDESWEVRQELAKRADCPVELLTMLAQDEDEGVRGAVARHRATPASTLVALAEDEEAGVRSCVPLGAACSDALARRLLTDPAQGVRDAAIWRLLANRSYADIMSRWPVRR